MRKIFILFLFLPFLGMAQPAEVVAQKIRATEKLQLSNKTLTAIVEAITVLSTHAQSPTAKAVYDLTAAMITSVSTNATLSGNGTAGDPLGIAQQSATSGQVLKWNGSTWLPAADDNTTQTISYSAPNLSLSGGGGSVAIPQGTVTGTGTANKVAYWSGTSALTATTNFGFDGSNLAVGTTTMPDRVSVSGDIGSNNLFLYRNSGTNAIVGRFGNAAMFNNGGIGDLGFRSTGNLLFGTTGSANSQMIITNAGNVGIGGILSPTYGLHYYKAAGSARMGIYSDFSSGSTVSPSYMGIDYQGSGGYVFGSITGVDRATNLLEGGLAFFADPNILTPTQSLRMFIEGANGNVGIGTGTTTGAKLDVAGNFKLTTRTGTATTIAGWGSDNISSDLALGTGLSITSGTLNASGTVGGTGTANKVAYWSGTNILTSTANFAFDGANLAVGTPTPGGGRLRVVGNSTSVCAQFDAGTLPNFGSQLQSTATTASGNSILGLDFTGTTTGTTTNYLHKLENNGTGSTILQLNSASAGGSPFVQYNIVGGSSNWTHGVDNADSRKFKIRPNADWSGTTGLTITTAGLVGIGNSSPAASLDMDATTDGIALSSGNTANRPASGLRWLRYNSNMAGLETRTASSNWHVLNSSNSVTLGAGAALGTAPTITVNNGSEMAYTVSLTVGTAPTANAVIFTRTFPNTWSVAPTVVFSAANQVTASEITKFYVDTQTTGQYTIRVNGTLSTPQTYKLNIILRN